MTGNRVQIIYTNKTQGRNTCGSAYSVSGFRPFNSHKTNNGFPTSVFSYTVDTMTINRVVAATASYALQSNQLPPYQKNYLVLHLSVPQASRE
jgi:hypothetical protein